MSVEFRTARPEDHAPIAAFTQDTFHWGDYVADRFLHWLDDEATEVFVAADDGVAVGIVRVELLTPQEAFLASARVDPQYRGRGVAGTLNDRCMSWAADQGALVGRLAVEEWNEPARRQVAKLGFRSVSSWNFSHLTPDESTPSNSTGLEAADESEAESAFGAWAMGGLARAAHELFQRDWTWRKMAISDLSLAARAGQLLSGPNGWLIAAKEEAEEVLWIPWLQTSHSEAPGLVAQLRGLAGDSNLIRVMAPSTPWLDEALARTGFELNPIQIYQKETAATG